MFFCEPFGRTDPDSLVNYGSDDTHEHNYTLLWDQEPIHLNIHFATFLSVFNRNRDLCNDTKYLYTTKNDRQVGSIITSEKNSNTVEYVCKKFNWKSYYYFFHGWAALDWYRGYNRTFLITPIEQRKIKKTFLAPTRIVAGERQHRLEMLYWIFKLGMTDNHISCPSVCPAENISIHDAILPLKKKYSDIDTVFNQQMLPINFKDETGHPMQSCWLDLFDQSAESLLYLVTETVASGRRYHLTEKTFKPIALGMPFVIVGTQGSLKYLRSYGFKTFGHLWDESYDDAEDKIRIERISALLHELDQLSIERKQELFTQAMPIIEHNWNHFYHGGFESVLWQELKDMLNELEFDRRPNHSR